MPARCHRIRSSSSSFFYSLNSISVYQAALTSQLNFVPNWYQNLHLGSACRAGSVAQRQTASGSSGERAFDLDEDGYDAEVSTFDRADRDQDALRIDGLLSLWSAATPN